ncbi:Putative methionine synthase reductase [Toxocara canis]|uniref:Putative methionine synthase reductase n=1 Tax=Toxocara canis TaxID=6265 RepID=A0A0B2UNJ0_TOXCA|nr:Putative methionine synthase reductase [Toxocara canis]
MLTSENNLLILYGSQTGQSEAIAKLIEERCIRLGICTRLFVLNDYEKKYWLEKEPLVVLICSSTGDGDPPDNAAIFVRRIARRSLQENFLRDTQFALLGML